jgi:hypothetical protein
MYNRAKKSKKTDWRARLANSTTSHKSFRFSVAKSQIVAVYGTFPNATYLSVGHLQRKFIAQYVYLFIYL